MEDNPIETHREFIIEVFNRYSPISEASISLLISMGKIQHLDKGSTLLSIGETSRHIHILYQGAIVSYYLNKEGDMYHKNIFLEGNIVGSMVSALKNEPSHFALEVVEKSTLISFDYRKYRELIDSQSDLKNFYVSYLEKNWVIDKEKREVEIVLKEAKERYLDFITLHPNIEARIPLQFIASHLGITPTQLSRIRKKIKEKSSNQHM
ncbi:MULTISPECIES: Crp/Fnr family transcriptional regulator [Flavobacteriaceae]|uniref:Crp/Fnr family transcriptional regulator n=1 Tax=Flavobacteriaceae TaxID=49546 RepID=UPI00234B070A|nr:Crp/Fnr family transcriptional regulator [Muricauda sp. SP22]MDC6361659.1 Crp/Fnr family transcriptional regulator [Muricauda sp. SP22]